MNGLSKCWGIGLSRTGTTSFCEALKLLGYKNVKHNPDFSELKGLDGAADLGVVVFYKYLDHKFPGSKFVLTLRDDLGEWLRSVEYILRVYPCSRDDDVAIMRRMAVYETVAFDGKRFIEAYHRHNADVCRYFAGRSHDLLEIKITAGEGWDKLCRFLGLPVLAVPFPHGNARTETVLVRDR